MVVRRATTDATGTVLTADGGSPGASNQFSVPLNSGATINVLLVGREKAGGTGKYAYQALVLARRDGTGTAISVGTPEILTSGTVTGWAVAISADTTNNAVRITVTGAAATNIQWVARLIAVETVG
jgi:hypothetical protein